MNSGNQPTSGNVGSVRDVSSMVANVGVAVGIVSPAHCDQLLFPLPVSVAAILNSVGGNVGNTICCKMTVINSQNLLQIW